jgi:hypothetical protein
VLTVVHPCFQYNFCFVPQPCFLPMPEPRKPCPCPKCKGALVSSRTVRNHASRTITTDVVRSFSAWLEATGRNKRPRTSRLFDGETGGPSLGPSYREDDIKPSKRHRQQSIMVCYHVPFALANCLSSILSFVNVSMS